MKPYFRAMKIGIIREGKTPPDNRVVLSPDQCKELLAKYPLAEIKIQIQSSSHRCYSDQEYQNAGLTLTDDISDCDILIGIKEVPMDLLIPNKTYFIFSHTIKKQSGNQKLIQAIIKKNITLIDYECITDENGNRLIAFGRFAGIVGAHNGLMAYGKRTGNFNLPRIKDFKNFEAMKNFYRSSSLSFPRLNIVVTGTGRVASGAVELLDFLDIKKVSKEEFLSYSVSSIELRESQPVYTQLTSDDLYSRISDGGFDRTEFHARPELYQCDFKPYTSLTDIMLNCVFWKKGIPPFFKVHDIHLNWFRIKTIADISCDVQGSVPITLRASTIDEPVYGIDKNTHLETAPYLPSSVDIMAVDNLPNELPRDASNEFGEKFINLVFPELLKMVGGDANHGSEMIDRATIVKNGELTERFEYLEDYAKN